VLLKINSFQLKKIIAFNLIRDLFRECLAYHTVHCNSWLMRKWRMRTINTERSRLTQNWWVIFCYHYFRICLLIYDVVSVYFLILMVRQCYFSVHTMICHLISLDVSHSNLTLTIFTIFIINSSRRLTFERKMSTTCCFWYHFCVEWEEKNIFYFFL
jgi:hypothetical protein